LTDEIRFVNSPASQFPHPHHVERYRHTTVLVIGEDDPTLPGDGTDLMPLRCVMDVIDPTLPRDGTDFMPLRCVR
jgi:hypothetical protein